VELRIRMPAVRIQFVFLQQTAADDDNGDECGDESNGGGWSRRRSRCSVTVLPGRRRCPDAAVTATSGA